MEGKRVHSPYINLIHKVIPLKLFLDNYRFWKPQKGLETANSVTEFTYEDVMKTKWNLLSEDMIDHHSYTAQLKQLRNCCLKNQNTSNQEIR